MHTKIYTILLIDDNEEVLELILDIFETDDCPYKVYTAANGKIALKVIEKFTPDLIISDWEMPQMNGLEFIMELQKHHLHKNIPVIMASGIMTSSENLKIALKTGAVDFIRKPIDRIELLARIDSVLKIQELNSRLIEQKNKELIESALLLTRNYEFNSELIKDLQAIAEELENTQIIDKLKLIIENINIKFRQDAWLRFNNAFDTANAGFFKNLTAYFPKLSPSEIKLCALIKLGLDNKDIAAVLFLSSDSVKVARSRLRKKMGLDREQNLQSFLSGF